MYNYLILRGRVGHRIASFSKMAESKAEIGFQRFSIVRVPRTLHSKSFSVLSLFCWFDYGKFVGVPRKRALKAKYNKGFRVPQVHQFP